MENENKHFVPLEELNEDEQKYLHLLVRYKRLIGKSPVDRGMMDLLNECLDKIEELEAENEPKVKFKIDHNGNLTRIKED